MTDHAFTTRRLLSARSPLHAALSPDGQWLTLTTSHVPLGTDEHVVGVTLLHIDSGREEPLRGAEAGAYGGVWSPEGRRIACTTERDGTSVLIVADLDAHTMALTSTSGASGTPAWSPDGSTIALPARRGVAVDRTRPFRWTRPILAFDGLGPIDDPPQLRIVDVASDTGRWLSDDGWRWSSPRWSPDGGRLAATVSLDPSGRTSGQFLRIVELDGTVHEPAVPGGRSIVATWMPDGRLAALVAEPRDRASGSEPHLYLVDGTDVRDIDLEHAFGDVYGDSPAELADITDFALLADESNRLIVRTGHRGRMGIVRVDPDDPSHVDVLVDGPRCASPVGYAHGRLVVTTQSVAAPAELALLDEHGERLLTSFAADVTPAVRVERFSVESDGFVIDAWFVAPRTSTASPLPTVLMVHGGPHFAYGDTFSNDTHALCAAGFGVLFANPRGSTGVSDSFAAAVHGDWADGPSRDVLAVLDHAVTLGLVDPARLGVTGNSYGGYMAAWLASTTNRFRAAVIENPVIDLLGMYATSDIGLLFFPAQFGGPPHEQLERYAAQSPLLHAHRCTTPCLFVVGTDDRRCPPAQAFAMHRVLCSVGTPSEVLVLPDSSHEGSTYGPPAGRFAHDAALVEWMIRWLLD